MPRTRRSLLWSLSERYVGLIITVASTVTLARLLTPHEVGIYSLCAAVVAVATILRDFGISEFLIQEKDLTHGKLQAAFAVALTVAWVFAGALLLGAGFVSRYYQEPGVRKVLWVLCLNFVLLPFASPAFALLNRDMAFDKIFWVQSSSNLVQAVTTVSLAYSGHSYMSLAWGSVASTAWQVALTTAMRLRDSFISPSFREAGVVWRYGMMFCATRVIEVINRNAHELFIGKQFGFDALGLFSRASGLVDLFYNSVTSAILRVATPAFAEGHRSSEPLKQSFLRSTTLFTGVAWPFFAFVALSSHDIIQVLFGIQWLQAAPIASILCVGSLLAAFGAFGPVLLTATGRVKRRLRISLILLPIQMASVAAASFVSLEAIAYVWILSNGLAVLLYAREIDSLIGLSLPSMMVACTRSAALTGITTLTSFLVATGLSAFGLPTLVNLLLIATMACVSWLASALMLRHPIADELNRLRLALPLARDSS